MPKLGESIVSATVIQWFKKVGDTVQVDEPLLEVSTDKVNSEIPAPISGTISEILAQVDEEYDVGDLLCVISSDAVVEETVIEVAAPQSTQTANDDFFSPAVLRLARQKKIPISELEKISGTGAGGRVTKQDVEKYNGAESTHVKMSGMRKAIAESMVKSFYEAPHASLIAEVDITGVLSEVKAKKASFLKEHGYKITITSYIAKAISQAAKKYPMINSSLEGDTIVLKKSVGLGIAVSVDQAILVPVIKNCCAKSLIEIAKDVAHLAEGARDKTLKPDDVKGGSITMTNFGMGGVQIGIPIIRHGEVAIIGVGAITRRVVPLDDDSTAIRSMVNISLTFDHRVLDGMYGCEFLAELKSCLESYL